ncbi:FUSC family protein [Stenotrophomonas indicatrix]|uniref:FUSC family protein n=1 Tax=Stenotrophomonas indicatrix TaxID=2045451 RepID=UPI0007395BFB|nr:FUSC family protein [Stenotrophomonas indicatrix]CRD52016.1 Fusaric acid resistance protein conserved region [Stenotrophomonas indicatrix]
MHIPVPTRPWLSRPIALLMSPALKGDGEAVLFSLKCLLAAILGLYVSLRIGLTRPFWVIGTVYLVSQPMSGATLSRGLFRLLGTVGGAVATVLLVPRFANAPLVLSVVLAAWMGLCLYLAMLDRTPRAYAFLLAGYTTSLIGFPAVMVPDDVFTIAVTRVQEISIGILAATLVHGLLLPRRVSPRVHARVASILADAEHWTRDMRVGANETVLAADRSKVAADLLDLHTLSIHLPFDSVHGVAQVQILRALHGRMLDVLMLSSAVDESLAQLRAQPAGTARTTWKELMRADLCARQAELDAAHHDCRLLEEQLHAARPDWRRHVPAHLARKANGHVLHRDHRIALRSALGAFVGIVLACALWIITAWSDGATAVSIIGTACVLFGTTEAPAGHVMRYLIGSTIGVGIGLFYALVIFPGLSDFVGLAMALAPALLVCGSFLARPPFIMGALGVVLTFPLIAGLGATNATHIAGALNSSVALFVGTAAALCSMSLLQTLDSNRSRARLQDVIRRDIARRAAGQVGNASDWTSRMVDRLALLAPRLRGHPDAAPALRTLFADMRAASAVAELRVIGGALNDRRSHDCLAQLLHSASAHFRIRTSTCRTVDTPLLESLERTREVIIAGSNGASERVLALLCGLRRDLIAPLIVHGD